MPNPDEEPLLRWDGLPIDPEDPYFAEGDDERSSGPYAPGPHDSECPEGVPQEVWDEVLAEGDEWQKQWVAAVTSHVTDYEASQVSTAK